MPNQSQPFKQLWVDSNVDGTTLREAAVVAVQTLNSILGFAGSRQKILSSVPSHQYEFRLVLILIAYLPQIAVSLSTMLSKEK